MSKDKAKERVLKELAELEEKTARLAEFIDDENRKYASLSLAAQRLLQEQYNIMQQYILVLRCRISIWEEYDDDNKL